jgi:hypothetical protein
VIFTSAVTEKAEGAMEVHIFIHSKACRTREQLAELTASHGGLANHVSLVCADRFREDLTSRGLEENIYRVWYFSPREEKISTSADVARFRLVQLTSQWEPIVSSRDFGQNGDNGGKCKRSYQRCCCWIVFPTCAVKMHGWASRHTRRLAQQVSLVCGRACSYEPS